MILSFTSILFFISCATTSKNTSSSGGVYVGDDIGNIGVVNDWKNPDFAGGKTRTVVAEGFAVVDGRGDADAIDRALDDAQRKAVEQAVGSIIQGSTSVENNRLINSQIYEKTTGYVSGYRVLTTRKSGSMYYAKIEASVGVDMIQDNLQAMGILIDRMNLPMIVVLVTDEYGNLSDSFNVELEKRMSEKGFRFVDSRTLQDVMDREKIKYGDILGSKSIDIIDKIGVGTGAQVAILGNASASYFTTIHGTAMKSYRSDVAVRAVNIADASTIAQSTHQTGGVGGSDRDASSIALVKSANTVSEDLISQITGKWQNIVQSGTEYTLLIVGLSFSDAIDFENALTSNIRGLKSVYNRGMTGDASRFVVRYIGSSRNLAVDLNAKASQIGYQIIIKSFDDKTITMNVSKR